jgi:hypothetical protein
MARQALDEVASLQNVEVTAGACVRKGQLILGTAAGSLLSVSLGTQKTSTVRHDVFMRTVTSIVYCSDPPTFVATSLDKGSTHENCIVFGGQFHAMRRFKGDIGGVFAGNMSADRRAVAWIGTEGVIRLAVRHRK